MAPPLPMVACKTLAIGFGGTTVGCLVWGAWNNTNQKIERKWCLCLRWSKLKWRHSNQPSVGAYGRGRIRGEAWLGWSAGGASYHQIGWQFKKWNKKLKYLEHSRPPMAGTHATTNQKEVSTLKNSMKRRFDSTGWERAEGVLFHHFGGVRFK
jgi:hypothetical protein